MIFSRSGDASTKAMRLAFGVLEKLTGWFIRTGCATNGEAELSPALAQSLYAVRNPPQWRPLTRIGTSISRIMMVLPLPMSRA